ncbi:hemicentin-1-like isoform X2 [Anguilla anguilla]|uniref:hemicentin-1-like isoform X2 n=1 Tax=Anguilla anguilla TaxID=7936 RepID=UPI0015AD508F|nr:hemicentin-1-like isoform X2 [Anguilla anguilla]
MCGGALMRILLGLLFFGVHAGAEAHSIQIHPASVVVRHGSSAAVNCTVSGKHDGIGWEASEGAVVVTDIQFVTWNPARITDWEMGPRCYGNFLNGTDILQDQRALQITLYKPPDSVSISVVNHTGPMLEGEQYQLQCEVQNIAPVQNLTVKWYKGETLENQTSYDALTKTPVNVSSTLLMKPTSADDGAQYSCVAELELGPEGPQPPPEVKSDPLNITVHYKPRITECPDHVKLREGESLDTLVSCRAEGNPSHVVTWYRDQSEFNGSTQLTRRDAGQYVMTAKNTLGSVSVNFTVGYGPIFNCSHKYEVTANERHALRCRAEGFPLPEVTWFKEDEEVELPAQMTRENEGQYILTARNAFGTANHSMEIDVLYPPSEIFKLESDAVDLGASVVLKCSSHGDPQPRYSWTYPSAANVLENSVDGVSLLHIFNASEENNGSYTCYAQNRIGHVNKTVSLIVRGKNSTTTISGCPLKMEPSTVVVRYGDPVSVNCTVSGGHDGIGWEASEGPVDMVSDVQFVPWSLKTLTDWETSPKCFGNFPIDADLDGRDQCSKELNITVYKPPDSVSISVVNHTGPMLEGEQYQLQCEVQNIAPVQNLTVKWYKGETLENQTSYDALTKTPVNVSSTLLITPTSADDGAQYSCVAELELGPEGPQPPPEVKSDPLNITVHYKPRITECPDHVKLREGESLDTLVSCRAEGNPSPVVTWYRNQSEFNSSTQLTRRDAGQYVMTAENTLGSVSVNFTVGYGPIFNCSHKYEVTANECHALRCRAEGFPLPEVTWFKEDKEVELPAQITWEDEGQYILTARNAFGTANHSMDINVLFSECPLKMEPSTVVVRYGDPVSVNCTVSGFHDGIGWEASEGSVDMVEDVQFVTWILETLTDWEIRPRCFGNFLFYADHFNCFEVLSITVYKPPDSVSISAVTHTDPMLEGKQYQLQCEVQNIAPVQYLTVKWYKGETLENRTSYDALTKTPVNVSSTLLITPTSADDGAQYSCVAELELGPEGPQPPPEVKSDPFNIIVRYSPFFSNDDDDETLEVTEGEGVPLRCSAQGNPLPAYSWSSPLDEEEKTSQIQITSTSLTPGTHVYTCTASNQLGQQSKNFTVKVVPQGDQTMLWMVIVIGLAVALFLILGYLYYKSRDGANSTI